MRQTILITGGTGKFGRAFVQHFVKCDWMVLFTSTCEKRAQELIKELNQPENLIYFVADLIPIDTIPRLAAEIHSEGYRINHLVNNARSLTSLRTNDLGQTDRDDFLNEYLMDVVIPYELAFAFYNTQADELLTITNIGSQYGLVAANPHLYTDYPKQSPIQYGVAKAALNHLTKELAVRMADKQVRVNCIAYGGVEGRVDDAFKARYANLSPTRRMLKDTEVISPLDFLVRENSSAVTGQTLVADGGWTLW
ncbi:SDR family oxidoreductase [Nitrincola iocasae]|uniref:SDR family oxidoreductase n=1 Tax=Nitrincola iocasae TaxID=2614693 RepID=A0A5J6LBL6_9GAMM|nr:SDR family oxidoreductase [Nitrincola iocasae]QEW05923.1 SDR family oxidoreductase [Nitrincola iocasae]